MAALPASSEKVFNKLKSRSIKKLSASAQIVLMFLLKQFLSKKSGFYFLSNTCVSERSPIGDDDDDSITRLAPSIL